MGLYHEQQKIVDELNTFYRQTNPITQNHYYLSGEMGVGKTYMGAQLALDHAQNGAIIVVPNVVLNKWVNVLNELKTNHIIQVMDNHNARVQPLISYQKDHITVIPDYLFNRLFRRDSDRHTQDYMMTVLDDMVDDRLNKIETLIQGLDVDAQKSYNFVQFRLRHAFLVYDEIHQCKQSKMDCLNALLNKDTQSFKPRQIQLHHFDQLLDQYEHTTNTKDMFPALFLTGTIFNTDRTVLRYLLDATNPKLLSYNSLVHPNDGMGGVPNNITTFLDQLWQYISVSISLESVQLENQDQINQTIKPIQAIPLTAEEAAFYELVRAQLAAKFPTKSHYQQQKNNLIASKFLDFPQLEPTMEIKKAKRSDYMFKFDQKILLAATLKPIPLVKTKKYQRLLTELKQIDTDQKIVIYVQDPDLIDQMTDQLNHDGYQTDQLPKRIQAVDYSQYINNSLKDHQIFIVDPKNVTVGVDIDAQILIWYQLLPDMTDIIQAQRRIYRMNSSRDSQVIFLPYALTYQEELVDAISNAAKNNAATYGIQDRSELAKKTHVLLSAIEQPKKGR